MEVLMRVLLTLFLSFISLAPSQASTDFSELSSNIDLAIGWLGSTQNVDGSFNSDNALRLQTSEEVLRAFFVSDRLSEISSDSLKGWFDIQEPRGTEFLARSSGAAFMMGEAPEEYLSYLSSLENKDGGYGSYSGDDSNVYDTTFALRAFLHKSDFYYSQIFKAIEYLRSQQEPDGSFKFEGNLPSVVLSSYVLIALQGAQFKFDVVAPIKEIQNYLLGILDSEEKHSSLDSWQLSLVLLSVVPVTTDVNRYLEAVDQLVADQQQNGSWQGDVYSTALATQLLERLKSIDQIDISVKAGIRGKIVESTSGQPISSARVVVDGKEVLTDLDGFFEIGELESGTKNLIYSADGYYDSVQTLELVESSLINTGVVPLTAIPSTAIIEGIIKDSETLSPMSNVQVTVTGTSTTSVTTDTSGYYRLVITPETVAIGIEKSGYLTLSANLEVIAGSTLLFSPEMRPDSQEPDSEIRLKGKVVDSVSGKALPGVTITVIGTSNTDLIEATADVDGYFIVSDLPEGHITIQLTLGGYQSLTANVLTSQGITFDMKTVQMAPNIKPATVNLTGLVTDNSGQVGIPNADITIRELGIPEYQSARTVAARTDINGNYSIDNIEFKKMEVFIRAAGYISQLATLEFTQGGHYEADFSLPEYGSGGVEITSVSTDKRTYSAYENMEITLGLANSGSEARRAFVQVDIIDESGQAVDHMMIGSTTETGFVEAVTLLPGIPINLSRYWNTTTTSPGDYQVLLTAFDNLTGQVLARRSHYISVGSSGYIDKISLLVDPMVSNITNVVDLSSVYQIKYVGNQSNVYTFEYSLIYPDGNVAFDGSFDVELNPLDINRVVYVEEYGYQFDFSGRYLLEASVVNQNIVIDPVWITVAPSTRPEVEIDLKPSQILPGDDRNITIDILLRGVEIK